MSSSEQTLFVALRRLPLLQPAQNKSSKSKFRWFFFWKEWHCGRRVSMSDQHNDQPGCVVQHKVPVVWVNLYTLTGCAISSLTFYWNISIQMYHTVDLNAALYTIALTACQGFSSQSLTFRAGPPPPSGSICCVHRELVCLGLVPWDSDSKHMLAHSSVY